MIRGKSGVAAGKWDDLVMANPKPTRMDDERILMQLKLRRSLDAHEIGRRFNMRQESVRVATNNVIKADSVAEGRDTRAEYGWISREDATAQGMKRVRR